VSFLKTTTSLLGSTVLSPLNPEPLTESQPEMLRCTAPSSRWHYLDASVIALKLFSDHYPVLRSLPEGETTTSAFFLAMDAEMRIISEPTEEPSFRRHILPQGWYLLFNKVLLLRNPDEDKSAETLFDGLAVVPSCLARLVIEYLQLTTEIGPESAMNISTEMAARLAADIARTTGLQNTTLVPTQHVPASSVGIMPGTNATSATYVFDCDWVWRA
jgi:hypothetical protein